MKLSRNTTTAFVTLIFGSFIASAALASDMDGVMMKDGKMVMMKDGKTSGPMDHEMPMSGCCKVMPDGTMKMKDGTEVHMTEGQMMTMDGKMMADGKVMPGGMMGGKGMMGGMGMEHGKGTMGDKPMPDPTTATPKADPPMDHE